MEPGVTDHLRAVLILTVFFCAVSSENDLDWNFCGTWRHNKGPLNLNVNVTTGCKRLTISADRSSLSIEGRITAQCDRSDVIPLQQFGLDSEEESQFCLYWEPLLDQLKLQVKDHNLTLCWPTSQKGDCCTDLSYGPKIPGWDFGIYRASVKDDPFNDSIQLAYGFDAGSTDCKKLCDQAIQGSTRVNKTAKAPEHPCAHSSSVDMDGEFTGHKFTSPATSASESTITVEINPTLKEAAKQTSTVECTFYKNNSLFQETPSETRILEDVVEITVGNEEISNLPEPIRIGFHHDVIPKIYERKCVAWDTRKDPLQVNWLEDGCETRVHGEKDTECLCNHLTYFSVLVQLKPRPVRHLLALTAITSLGCAVSFISCVGLIIYLCRKSKRSKEAISIHLGLAISLALLNLLFFFTGVLANVENGRYCPWVGAGLHYALLSSLIWMGIEVFHTFWMVYMIFSPSPGNWIWNLVGFALPAVPVIILVAVGNIYGKRELREVAPSDDMSDPFRMCWMTTTPEAKLAHYFTNLTILVILVVSGAVMLFLVYRKISKRDEWRQNRVAFFSIWGLSCLFGSTWGLNFLEFGPLADFVLFVTCILNSFQGLLLMLRFVILDRMRKQGGGSSLGSTSSGSTRQHMLQAPEKS